MILEEQLKSGISHHQAGRLAEAEEIYRQILARHPDHPAALNLMGALSGQVGQLSEAEKLIRRAVLVRPDFAEAHINLGFILQQTGKLDEAIASHREAVRLKPDYAKAHRNLGNALRDSGRPNEAVASYRMAVRLNPDYADVHCNLGIVLMEIGQIEEAIVSYRQAIRLTPDYAKTHNNLGIALRANGQLGDAIASYLQAIRINPDYSEAYNNLGNALNDTGQLDGAVAAYRQAVRLKPDYAHAHNNLGDALKDIGQLDEAIASYRQCIRLRPDYTGAHSNLIFALHYHPDYDSRMIHEELRRWNQMHAEPLKRVIKPQPNNRDPDRRLRIGYVSPDFRVHPVGQNLLPLLGAHDHRQVEIFCYSNVVKPDALTERLRRHSDTWRSIVGLPDSQVADLIRQDEIDVLVDLTLHTANNRLVMFAQKPAPVQATYLAYCGSTGMDAMDYRLSDPHLDPLDSDLSVYSERTIRLPETYWCYGLTGPTPEPSALPAAGSGYITFGCLNNFAKVSPALDLWTEILQRTPGSRLIVHSHPGLHLDAVRDRFAGNGVSPDRLEFMGNRRWHEYLQIYGRIDIALDPFPWSGGITTCDALWMGVPVVTLVGRTAVGRGGASILANIGLPELIARTPEQYVRIASDLAKDLRRLAELRHTLRSRMQASPLMDAPRFARNIETAYRQMWRNWCEASAAK